MAGVRAKLEALRAAENAGPAPADDNDDAEIVDDNDANVYTAFGGSRSASPPWALRASEPDDDDIPELSVDPREFRARVIAMEKAGMDPLEAASKAGTPRADGVSADEWVHETGLIEQGSVILGGVESSFGFALRQQYFHKVCRL